MNATDRTATNRANAAHSTGPKSAEGRQRASMNALKHGLTGQRLILQPEEHEAYRSLSKSLRHELRPKTEMELQLVQKIIDTHLRLNRVAALDNNLLNFGLIENCRDTKDGGAEDAETEIAHAQARSWVAHQMSFEKLGRYEARLSRQLIAYSKELDRLQSLRAEQEQSRGYQRLTERIRARRTAEQTAANASAAQLSPTENDPNPRPLASFGSTPGQGTPDQSEPSPLPPLAA